MEKMRDEFEAWFWDYNHNDCTKDYWSVVFAIGCDGKYQGIACEGAWQGWKASRAALCIELPKTPSFSASDEPDLAFEEGVDVMKEIIEAEGVTCK